MEAGSATAAPCPQVDPHPLPHNQIGGRPRWRWRQRQLRRRQRRSPLPWRFGCSSIYSKNSTPPSFILSGRPFFEVIAQGCNWIAVISATGNTKCCNLSINRGGPRQADPYAGERGGGARVWPTCGRVGRVGPGRARGGAQAGRRAGGGAGREGVCAFAVANATRCILASPCVCLYIEQHLLEGETHL